mgnify:CR=1 FL=1
MTGIGRKVAHWQRAVEWSEVFHRGFVACRLDRTLPSGLGLRRWRRRNHPRRRRLNRFVVRARWHAVIDRMPTVEADRDDLGRSAFAFALVNDLPGGSFCPLDVAPRCLSGRDLIHRRVVGQLTIDGDHVLSPGCGRTEYRGRCGDSASQQGTSTRGNTTVAAGGQHRHSSRKFES